MNLPLPFVLRPGALSVGLPNGTVCVIPAKIVVGTEGEEPSVAVEIGEAAARNLSHAIYVDFRSRDDEEPAPDA